MVYGKNNFKQSTFKLLSSLMDEKYTFCYKYICKTIKSPIDSLYQELKKPVQKHKKLLQELESISDEINEMNEE